MARQFDRPVSGNMKTEAQVVRYFDKFLTALESVTTDLQDQITAIAAAQAAADAAQAAADAAASDAATAQTAANNAQSTANTAQSTANTANTTANTANTTANKVKRNNGISSSWIVPGEVLSASDAGSNATISIAAHTRYYDDPDISAVSISADTITNRSYSTTYYIYYTDTTQSDTTPTFQSTTNANTAMSNKVAGRHYVGKITTPASGAADTSGGYSPPSGGGSLDPIEMVP